MTKSYLLTLLLSIAVGCFLALWHPISNSISTMHYYKVNIKDTNKSYYLLLKSDESNPIYKLQLKGPFEYIWEAHQILSQGDLQVNGKWILKQLPILGNIE